MGKTYRHISPLLEFSPITVKIRNAHAKKSITVMLFDQKYVNPSISLSLEHPDIKYPVLCSLLEKVQFTMYKTDMELVRAQLSQAQNPIRLFSSEGIPRQEIPFRLKSAELTTNRIAVNTMIYRIGVRHGASLVIEPKSCIRLTFFLSYSQPQNTAPHAIPDRSLKTTGRSDQ